MAWRGRLSLLILLTSEHLLVPHTHAEGGSLSFALLDHSSMAFLSDPSHWISVVDWDHA